MSFYTTILQSAQTKLDIKKFIYFSIMKPKGIPCPFSLERNVPSPQHTVYVQQTFVERMNKLILLDA